MTLLYAICHIAFINTLIKFYDCYTDWVWVKELCNASLFVTGASLHAVPDPSSAVLDILSRRPFPFDTEAEQVVILTMSGGQTLQRAGHFLRQIFRLRAKKQEVVSGRLFFDYSVSNTNTILISKVLRCCIFAYPDGRIFRHLCLILHL